MAGVGGAGFCGDGGPAISACLDYPVSPAADSAGNLYIADSYNKRVRKVDTAGNISTVAGIPGSTGYGGDGGPATAPSSITRPGHHRLQ